MTDNDPTSDTPTGDVPTDTEPTDTSPEATTVDSSDPADARAGRDAARYRRQLREAEGQRDELQTRVESAQRALIDHLAETVGRVRPLALWASGATLATLLDTAGDVDPSAVLAACEAAASAFSLSRTPRPDPSMGRGASRSDDSGTLADAFRPR